MIFSRYNINRFKESIDSKLLNVRCRKNEKDFTRERKLTPKDLILYTINNRGKTTKMELYDFLKQYNMEEVSTPALLKQREKLREEIFKEFTKESLIRFYKIFPNEVKTLKGYVVAAIDGSDCEVPNTKETRERYQSLNATKDNRVARIKLSNCYDVLNKYVLETEIEEYKHSELDLAKKHIEKTKYIHEWFPIIYTMDRGYFSLSNIYHWIQENVKFVIRLKKTNLKIEQSMMISEDEIIEIQYQYDQIKNYKEKDPEFYEYYELGNRMKVRFVNIKLPSGEIETIITNLSQEEFGKEDINKIYQSRWGIETSYHELKESMQVTNISSSKDGIIKQEIYSQMMVYNLVQSIVNEQEENIDQERYKHPMKVNFNMAVGFVKRFFVEILIEDDEKRRQELSDVLFDTILQYLVPIRKGRKYERDKNKKLTNKHPINKRKSY